MAYSTQVWVQAVVEYFTMFEIFYQLCKPVVRHWAGISLRSGRKADYDKIVEKGPQYLLSTFHALVVSVLSAIHCYDFFQVDAIDQLAYRDVDSLMSGPWYRNPVNSGCIFVAYIAVDALHMLTKYPKLGSKDMLLHHFAFLFCAIVGLEHPGMYVLAFSWLLAGEISTPFLNFMLFLPMIHCGDGSLALASKVAFMIVFFLVRFVLYAYGLYNHFTTMHLVFESSKFASIAMTSLMVVGFGLNTMWFGLIVKKAQRAAAKLKGKEVKVE